jgi:HAMP domain-containing protein
VRAVGLGTRVTAVFALGALAVSVALAGATYEIVRASLLEEREDAAVRAATLDGSLVRQGLAGDQPDIALVLRNLDTGEARRPLVRSDGAWFARTADDRLTPAVSSELRELVEDGTPAVQRVRVREEPLLVVGIPLEDGVSYYEVTSLEELRRTLAVLATVLGLVALGTTLAGAGVGWWGSRLVLRPLGDVARTAATIASGDLSARVSRDSDPDLDRLAVAFNAMVDEVSARSGGRPAVRRRTFKPRAPLAPADAVGRHLGAGPPAVRARRRPGRRRPADRRGDALRAAGHRPARAGAGRPAGERPPLPTSSRSPGPRRRPGLCGRRGAGHRRTGTLLESTPAASSSWSSTWSTRANTAVAPCGSAVDVVDAAGAEVDDEGPGRARPTSAACLRRFARGRAASARGGSEGTGLGLAIVGQHVSAHRGSVVVLDRPGGGARFRVELPGRVSSEGPG